MSTNENDFLRRLEQSLGTVRQAVDPTTPGFFDRGVPGLLRGMVEGVQRDPLGIQTAKEGFRLGTQGIEEGDLLKNLTGLGMVGMVGADMFPAGRGARRVVDSAFRTADGRILKAPRPQGSSGIRPHPNVLEELPAEERALATAPGAPVESGFLDQQGNFLTRDEAFEITGRKESSEFPNVELREMSQGSAVQAPERPPDMDALLRGLRGG